MQDLKITLIQSDLIWENKPANLNRFEDKLHKIDDYPDIVVLPEMFNTGFSMKPEVFAEKAENSETLKWMLEQASTHHFAITGSFMVEENGKHFNRLYFVEPDGRFHFYDKRHLFRMGNEDMHFDQGEKQLLIDYKGWKINFLICYDLRFPVWAKNNFNGLNFDYDLLILVANWPAVRSRVWKTLLSARAIENQVWVVGVNRVGNDGNGLPHSGNSNVYDPKGTPIFDENDEKEFIQTATLSFDELADFRSKFAVGLDWDKFDIELTAQNNKTQEKYQDRKIQKDYNG